MPRIRQEIAQSVAERLLAAEAAIDLAVARAAELAAAMPTARTEARLPAMIGQDALSQATGALTTLVEARRQMVAAHGALDQARVEIGLQEVAAGDLIPKPSPSGSSEPRIRAVA